MPRFEFFGRRKRGLTPNSRQGGEAMPPPPPRKFGVAPENTRLNVSYAASPLLDDEAPIGGNRTVVGGTPTGPSLAHDGVIGGDLMFWRDRAMRLQNSLDALRAFYFDSLPINAVFADMSEEAERKRWAALWRTLNRVIWGIGPRSEQDILALLDTGPFDLDPSKRAASVALCLKKHREADAYRATLVAVRRTLEDETRDRFAEHGRAAVRERAGGLVGRIDNVLQAYDRPSGAKGVSSSEPDASPVAPRDERSTPKTSTGLFGWLARRLERRERSRPPEPAPSQAAARKWNEAESAIRAARGEEPLR